MCSVNKWNDLRCWRVVRAFGEARLCLAWRKRFMELWTLPQFTFCDDATLLEALFVVNLKMSSCFQEILEDYVCRKQPVSALHTLRSFWPPWFCALAWRSDVWSDSGAQHGARVFLWIIFIGNKLFSFSWKWGDLLWVHFLQTPVNSPTVCTRSTLMPADAHIRTCTD